MMNEKEKMLNEKLYSCGDKDLQARQNEAYYLCLEYNSLAKDNPRRNEIIKKLLPNVGKNNAFNGPIWFDYGENFYSGENCFYNYNFVVMDCAKVRVGDNVFFGPNVTIAPPFHPLLAKERNIFQNENGYTDLEYAKHVNIGSNCWIASNVVICGNVTIGEGSVIGAGSVVTKDIPPNSLAFGNPCAVKRKITAADSVYLKKDLF